MSVNIKGTRLPLTGSVLTYLNKKLKSLYKFVDLDSDNVHMQVEVEKTTRRQKSGNIYRAEINLRVGGKKFRAEVKENDILIAIDLVKDTLVQELSKHKSKSKTKNRKQAVVAKRMLRKA